MARGRKQPTQAVSQPTVTPAEPTTTAPSTSSPLPSRSLRTPSPLPFAHYLPRIPLQLAAVFFSLLFSAGGREGIRSNPSTRIVTSIIHEPLRTLPIACASLALVQTWFGLWCKSSRTKADELAKKGGKVEKVKPRRQRRTAKDIFGEMWNRAKTGELPHKTILKAITEPDKNGKSPIDTDFIVPAVATTLVGAGAIHVGAVLLGAPLTSNVVETALLSLLVSILAILPLAIAVPPILAPNSPTNRYVWLRCFSSISPNDDLELALLAPALGAILGCWLGAVPIPLDWDRPWQVWPTTCVVGALLGHAAGSVCSLGISAFRTAARVAQESLDEGKEE